MSRRWSPKRVLLRFVSEHGVASRTGWTGDRADMLAMQLVLQACEVHRGVRPRIDLNEAETETDRLMQSQKGQA